MEDLKNKLLEFKKLDDEVLERLQNHQPEQLKLNLGIKNVGKDADIITNEKGGKQSSTAYSLHLLDGSFLKAFNDDGLGVFDKIGWFMRTGEKPYLIDVLNNLGVNYLDVLLEIGEVLKEGASKYTVNNWRLIPQEEHLNHALIHYIAFLKGDERDNHRGHFMTRIMMAYATETSEGFSYSEYRG